MIDSNTFLICFSVVAAILMASIAGAVIKKSRSYKRGATLKPLHILAAGIFIAGTVAFMPIYADFFSTRGDKTGDIFLTVMMSLHNSIRLFVVDGDFHVVLDVTEKIDNDTVTLMYNVICSVLFIGAPLMSASFLLSFFESITSKIKYFLNFNKDVYIFSELNEKSLILASSLKKSFPHCAIIFTDVFKNNTEQSYEYIEQAKELGAITFKNDITVVNFRTFHRKSTKMYFFILGDDESENIKQTITLASKPAKTILKLQRQKGQILSAHSVGGYDYPRSGDTRVYLCSTTDSFEHQLNALNTEHIKIRRVNEVRSLIYHTLFYNGNILFDSALPTKGSVLNKATMEQDEEKLISVTIVGLGRHGSEMIRALVWFAQMHPYRLVINAFDADVNAESNFKSLCPEIMDDKHNRDFSTEGEAHYSINIFGGCDVNSIDFDEKIRSLTDTTYVLMALGTDDLNIQTAVKIRTLLLRGGCDPVIHAIVYDPDKTLLLSLGHNKGKLDYNITPIGDLAAHYCAECILASEIEELALGRHLSYYNCKTKQEEEAAAESFWRSDYNYRSSTASVIHNRYKLYCNIPGAGKKKNPDFDSILELAKSSDPDADRKAKATFAKLLESEEAQKDTPDGIRTPRETDMLRRIEHNRWNAYVRSEGYVFAEKRNKMAKTHHLLIPFDELEYVEQAKDDD